MRIKLDENLGRRAAEAFRAAGHDVATAHEQQLTSATDQEVFDVCVSEGRLLVSLDIDFANPLRFDRSKVLASRCSAFTASRLAMNSTTQREHFSMPSSGRMSRVTSGWFAVNASASTRRVPKKATLDGKGKEAGGRRGRARPPQGSLTHPCLACELVPRARLTTRPGYKKKARGPAETLSPSSTSVAPGGWRVTSASGRRPDRRHFLPELARSNSSALRTVPRCSRNSPATRARHVLGKFDDCARQFCAVFHLQRSGASSAHWRILAWPGKWAPGVRVLL
ncbi:MAG: DUF5615 family PIN-like protein [Candidatus Dormibacteria bacterium]